MVIETTEAYPEMSLRQLIGESGANISKTTNLEALKDNQFQ